MKSSIFIVQFKEIFDEVRWEISGKRKETEETLRLLFAKKRKMDIVVRETIRINVFSLHSQCAKKTSRLGKHGDEEWWSR